MNVTREHLTLLAERYRPNKTVPNVAQWLLDNGRDFEFSPRPKGVRQRAWKKCYLNAALFSGKNSNRYVYVEGFATSSLTASHAWCYDRETGLIVDPTWKDGGDYVGVGFRAEYVLDAMLTDGTCGSLIEDWEHGYPLITGAIARAEWEERL
jgi:hypothetical protein